MDAVPEPVLERLVRIETKLDLNSVNFADHEARIRALEADNTPGGHQDHESRIRRLERSLWLLTGAAATVGGVVGSALGPLLGRF